MSSPTIHTKYFKWKEFKDELYTHQLVNNSAIFNREENKTDEQLLTENQDLKVLIKDYFLEDYENREHICEVKYLTEKNLTAWKKEQSRQINLTEIAYEEYKNLRDANRVYKLQLEQIKATRGNELENSKINIENPNVDLNSNEEAMIRYTYLVTLANAKYNLAVASGTSPEEAAKIYDTRFRWKTYQNEWQEMSIKDLATALEKSIMNLQVIWTKYN